MRELGEQVWIRILMTDRAPVEIEEGAWQLRATATHTSEMFEGQDAVMTLREHEDGRLILYGVANGALGRRHAGAFLSPSDDLALKVKETAQELQLDRNVLVGDMLAQLPTERIV